MPNLAQESVSTIPKQIEDLSLLDEIERTAGVSRLDMRPMRNVWTSSLSEWLALSAIYRRVIQTMPIFIGISD